MKKLSTMISVDNRRMFRQPLLYVLMGISFLIPVLVLTMTTAFSGDGGSSTGFVNVWQMIGSLPGSGMGMDMSAMMNINIVYFIAAVLTCVFTASDFRSGYVKNLFTVRGKKGNYVASKIIVCSVAALFLFASFFIGSILGGVVSGLSFEMVGFGIFNILMSMLSKLFILPMFVSAFVITAVIAKRRLWLSICLSLSIGMLLFMIVPMMTGLSASIMQGGMCLAGGVLFSLGFGSVSKGVLRKADLV